MPSVNDDTDSPNQVADGKPSCPSEETQIKTDHSGDYGQVGLQESGSTQPAVSVSRMSLRSDSDVSVEEDDVTRSRVRSLESPSASHSSRPTVSVSRMSLRSDSDVSVEEDDVTRSRVRSLESPSASHSSRPTVSVSRMSLRSDSDVSVEEDDVTRSRVRSLESPSASHSSRPTVSVSRMSLRSDSDVSVEEDDVTRSRVRSLDSPSISHSSLVVLVDESSGQTDKRQMAGSIQRTSRHRPRLRRQQTYPDSRSRSLSASRTRVRGLVPRAAPRLRVSRSRIDAIIPHPHHQTKDEDESHRVEGTEEEEEEEEEEEWQYVPFSFCRLPRRDKLILLSLGCIDFTLYMCLSVLAPFYPSEAAIRGVNGSVSGWVFGCFALTQFIFSPVFGYLLPKLGARLMVLVGHFMAGGCTILFGLLDYIPYDDGGLVFVSFCFLVRIMLAIGCTASATGSFSIMTNTFPDHVATVFGLLETFTGVGLMVGPALGGVLYEAKGFMLPFVSLGVVMVLSVPVNMYILPAQDETAGGKLESGSLRQVLCIPAVIVIMVATVIGALIWAILDPTLEPHFKVYSLSPSMIGLIFLLMSTFYAISSPFWGWIADRVEDSTPLMVLGFLAASVGLLLLGPSSLLGFAPGYRELWLDLTALTILGISVSLAVVPTYEKILDAAEKAGVEDNIAMYSNVAGLWGGAYALGEFIGPSAGGFLVDEIGFDWCMTYTAGLCVLIALVLFVLWVYEKKVGPTPCLIKVKQARKVAAPTSEKRPLLEPLASGSTSYGTTGSLSRTVNILSVDENDYNPLTQSI